MSVSAPPSEISNDAWSRLFSDLIGSQINVQTGTAVLPNDVRPLTIVGIYTRDDRRTLGSVAVCDVAAANFAGGLLSGMPRSVIEEGMRVCRVAPGVLDNFREVLNVATGILNNRPNAPHLVLNEVRFCPPPLPPILNAVIGSPNCQNLKIEVPSFGTGRMSFYFPGRHSAAIAKKAQQATPAPAATPLSANAPHTAHSEMAHAH